MAIAFDAASNGTTTGATLTVAHVCAASPSILIVSVAQQGAPGTPSATYSGVAMTKLTTQAYTNGQGDVFWLANPAAGTHNIVVSTPANSTSLAAASYTSFLGSLDGNNGNSSTSATSLTASITTVVDNCWVVLGVAAQISSQSASTGATQRALGGQVNCSAGIYDNNAAKHPAGSVSESVTFSTAGYGYTIISIKPTNPQTVTDSVSETDKLFNGNLLTERVTLITVYLKVFAEIVATSDVYLHFTRGFKNLLKNISNWINTPKS